MKIVNRSSFLALPAGTLFAAYDGLADFGPPRIKEDTNTAGEDFLYQELVESDAIAAGPGLHSGQVLEDATTQGTSFCMNLHMQCRDGLFEENSRLYVIWERPDLEALIGRLQSALRTAP